MSGRPDGAPRAKRDPREFLPLDQDFAALRETVVHDVVNDFTRGERRGKVFGARRPDFFEHMNELRSEFIDRSELLFIHAGCVVALRRRLAVAHFLPLYLRLWREETPFLRRELSLRWLVSACDTLVDRGETPVQRAVDEVRMLAGDLVRREGFGQPGDPYVAIAGVPFGQSGTTNLMHIGIV